MPATIELNLEESGWLCHLLMADLKPYIEGKKFEHTCIMSAEAQRAVFERKCKLYNKLAALNQHLMRE